MEQRRLTVCQNAGWLRAAVLFVCGAVVFAELHVAAAAVGVVFAGVGVLQSAVDAAVGQRAEADELAVTLSVVEVFEIDVLVVRGAAVAADAGPQEPPTVFARAHCFVGD